MLRTTSMAMGMVLIVACSAGSNANNGGDDDSGATSTENGGSSGTGGSAGTTVSDDAAAGSSASGAGGGSGGSDNAGGAGGDSSGSGGSAGDYPVTKVDGGKRVFVTSAMQGGGDFHGLAGADAKCQAAADAANLGGTYKVWLSDSTANGNPKARFAHSTGPYTLVDKTLVAQSWDDLTSKPLVHPINMTEKGDPAPTYNTSACPGGPQILVFTGTNSDGTPIPGKNCSNWLHSNGVETPAVGMGNQVDKRWSSGCTPFCNIFSPFYCFEQ